MSIKGFIGFFGRLQESVISPCLWDKYKLAIYNGVSFRNAGYTVIISDEYIISQEENLLRFKYGKDRLSDSNNMTVLIEISESSLLIERDRWGTRMVYYVCDRENIYFASDMRFLLELPINNIRGYDYNSLSESAVLGYIYAENHTLFSKINQLPRNSRLNMSKGNLIIEKNNLSANKQRFKSFEVASLAFSNAFENAILEASKIGGKKAYLLSGGMDSSAIAIAASKIEQIDAISFSSDNNIDDIFYAKKLADNIDCKHIIYTFDRDKAIIDFPVFLYDTENVEMEGIFSPLGGYAYYLLCKEIHQAGYDVIFPGEGADEILGGYYWALTHTFGFVDKLKNNATDTFLYEKVVGLFPEIEERNIYREIAYYLLQGSALTNYHLSCVEHTAKASGLFNYPIYMTYVIYDIVKDIPMDWLCDGRDTKLVLRSYLGRFLENIGLSRLMTRKKLAMPSVVTIDFMKKLYLLAEKEAKMSNNPYSNILKGKPLNIFMLDVFHKYYTLNPMKPIDVDMWKEDLTRIENGESIIYW